MKSTEFPGIAPRVSRPAFTAATARAAHLLVNAQPLIFSDTLAARLHRDRAEELLACHQLHGMHPILARAAPKRCAGTGSPKCA